MQVYVERFGELKDDWGLAAEIDGKVVGAVWVRIMNDYGHIDDETPSLATAAFLFLFKKPIKRIHHGELPIKIKVSKGHRKFFIQQIAQNIARCQTAAKGFPKYSG